MASINIINMDGEQVSQMDIDDNIFDIKVSEHAVHMAVVHHLANCRQGTKSTLTRGEVRGGGRKPWRQKGTGRARQGSIRSPQWKGGGLAFAPKPRDFSFKMNKKLKRLALKSVLTNKYRTDKLIVLDELDVPEIKTKAIAKIYNNIDATNAFVVLLGSPRNVILSSGNIPGIKTAGINNINVYDILNHDKLVVTREAIEKIQEVYA